MEYVRGSTLLNELEVSELVVAVLAEQLLRLGLDVQRLCLQLPEPRFRLQTLGVGVPRSLELADYLAPQLGVPPAQIFLALLVQDRLRELVH